jgi:hypothetical protein
MNGFVEMEKWTSPFKIFGCGKEPPGHRRLVSQHGYTGDRAVTIITHALTSNKSFAC